ncbi:MAG TPA: hypothetical protein VIS72_14460 [Anaerolineales bacterium]
MSRLSKYLLLFVLIVFVLACNFVTQPISDAQEAVETVQSFATAMPLETLQSFATSMPLETIVAIPSAMPDIGDITDPQDEPLAEWNGIPVMPVATAGAESSDLYSFKAQATVTEVFDYYKAEMVNLGWTEFFSVPDTGGGALLTFEKEGSTATITITSIDGGESLVFLANQ